MQNSDAANLAEFLGMFEDERKNGYVWDDPTGNDDDGMIWLDKEEARYKYYFRAADYANIIELREKLVYDKKEAINIYYDSSMELWNCIVYNPLDSKGEYSTIAQGVTPNSAELNAYALIVKKLKELTNAS